MTMTVVRSLALAASSAASRSPIDDALTAIAPMLSACLRKSMSGCATMAQSCQRLLKLAPPVAICRRLMQPKPWLSSTTMMSFWPRLTEVAISEFNIM